MPNRFEVVSECPRCGGSVKVETGSGTFSGHLRYVSFDEFQEHRRIVWEKNSGEAFALLADLVDLGVLCPSRLRVAVVETEDGRIVPVGVPGSALVNREPLLDALRRRQPRRHLPRPQGDGAGRPLGRE